MMYRYLSVCSGIEAFTVAVRELDFDAAAFAEIEDFPSKVLAHHYPDVPNLGDMTKIDVLKLGRIDWLVGGTPCQSFSVAGLRRGLDDDRGNLSLEYVRLAHELAERNGLRGLLWENVPGVLSDKTNAFGCFLGAIVGHDDPLLPGDKPGWGRSNKFWRWINPREKEPIYDDEGQETGEFTIATEGYHRPGWPSVGMASGPRARLAWRVLDSRHFGVAQRRRRVFLVADFGGGFDPATVLFEPRGKGRSVEASGEAGEEIAGTLGGSSQSGGVRTTDLDGSGAFIVPPVTGMNSRTGNERTETDALVSVVYEGNAEGGNPDLPSMNASNGKKGVNNQTPLISVFDPNQITSKANRSHPEPEMAHTMPATANSPVLFSITPSNSNKDYKANEKDISQAVTGDSGGGPSARGGDGVVHAIQERATSTNLDNGPGGKGYQEDIAYTMEARNKVQAIASAQVRRLVPEECEKLQGYPVGYTRIPGLSGWRAVGDDESPDELRAAGMAVKVNPKTGKARVNDPDGPRYKALGNSFTTEPVNWIMCRVQASLRGEPMPPWQPLQLWKTPPV